MNTRTSVRRKSQPKGSGEQARSEEDQNWIDFHGLNRKLKLSDEKIDFKREVDIKDLMFDHTNNEVKEGEIGFGISPSKKKKKKEDPIENET